MGMDFFKSPGFSIFLKVYNYRSKMVILTFSTLKISTLI
ncbi:Uncharacterised protein [Anaerobiospirillum thomasii]|nr:Uncharacterised protein [Anaerobiospirillum thomasii]